MKEKGAPTLPSQHMLIPAVASVNERCLDLVLFTFCGQRLPLMGLHSTFLLCVLKFSNPWHRIHVQSSRAEDAEMPYSPAIKRKWKLVDKGSSVLVCMKLENSKSAYAQHSKEIEEVKAVLSQVMPHFIDFSSFPISVILVSPSLVL